jgi:hypothetical protein
MLLQGEWDRKEWAKWGDHFGWELETSNRDGAEFRIQADNEQGYEFMMIPNRARLAIDRVVDDAGAGS